MSKFMYALMVIALLVISVAAFAQTPPQSWDQANLKKGDSGCPTAVFHNDSTGVQVICPPVVTQGEAGTTTYYPDGGVEPSIALLTMEIHKEPKGYPTIEAAAVAALAAIAAKPTSYYYEWGGSLARNVKTGEFFYSPANTTMHGDHVHLDEPEDNPGFEYVGAYHTHPCLPHHEIEYFSPGDMAETLYMHTAAFMGSFCSGQVHEFLPGDKPDAEFVEKAGQWLTKGRIVGSFTDPRPQLVVE